MEKETYLKELEKEIKRCTLGEKYAKLCVSYAKGLLDSGLPVIFDIDHLCLLMGIKKSDLTKFIYADYCFYTQFQIPKKSGGKRELDVPSADLKYIQRWILDNILSHMHISEHATGFYDNRSILDNAKRHTNQSCVLNMDLKDFFPSIIRKK